jgi:TonB family protein
MTIRVLAAALLAIGIATPALAQNGDSLATARDLYAAARYDEALVVLNGLRPSDGPGPVDRKSIEQYRSLCLLALGRGTEAEEAIAAVVNADPMFQPSEADASPRVRGAFTEVRQRLLPEIAASRYKAAKAAFDAKHHAAAIVQFRQLIALLDDPDMRGRLQDLRMLAAGFLDLSIAASTPPPAPKKVEAPAPPPAPPQAQPGRIYDSTTPGVTAPGVIRQEMPAVPNNILSQVRARGIVEVLIDEQGRVTAVTVRQSIHPVYDQTLMNAARAWRYRPASVNGVPVKFRKLIHVSVAK